MSSGNLLYHQEQNYLELNGIILRTGERVEIRVMGYWIPGRIHKDSEGWYLITSDQMGIRLRSGLVARFPEKSSSLIPQTEGHSHRPGSPKGEDRKWILVVEDDEAHASMLGELFKEETPYDVCYTSDGQAAWKFLQHFKPNLLVLDYLLPKMNGLVLYDRIRAEKELYNIPVLMISAALPSNEIEQRGIIGLQKPFEIDAFLHAIEALIASA